MSNVNEIASEPTLKRQDSWKDLSRTISGVMHASQDQQKEVSNWREVLGELDQTIAKLDRSCELFHKNLRQIRIGRLRHRSLQLVEIMDSCLQSEPRRARAPNRVDAA